MLPLPWTRFIEITKIFIVVSIHDPSPSDFPEVFRQET